MSDLTPAERAEWMPPVGAMLITPEDLAAGWVVLNPEQGKLLAKLIVQYIPDRLGALALLAGGSAHDKQAKEHLQEAFRLAVQAFAQYAFKTDSPAEQVIVDCMDGFMQGAELHALARRSAPDPCGATFDDHVCTLPRGHDGNHTDGGLPTSWWWKS